MGNANCTKCLQDCDGSKEMDLKPSVTPTQIILRAFGNLRDPSIESPHKRPQRAPKPQASALETESILKIQSYWRTFTSQKQYSLIKRLLKHNHSYFSHSELTSTLSSKPIFRKSRSELFSYPTGGTYKGEWLGGFRHGFGVMTWSDNSSYQGTWSYGYPFGFGKFTFVDNDFYSGEWKAPYAGSNCQTSFEGKVSGQDGEFSDGYCKSYVVWLWVKCENGKESGSKGKLDRILKKVEGKIEGQAQIVQETKMLLQGIFDGFEKKFSQVELEGGAKYWGEMVAGKRVGRGVNKWENGDKYSGEWQRDLQHGKGWNDWVDGSSYVGEYKDGVKDGLGEYNWEDGTKYIGAWKENNIDGIGKYNWRDGREYFGEWSNGAMHGFGVFTSKDGKRYQCMWVNGKKHGSGLTFYKDGKVTQDSWEHGKLLKSATG